jgi:hypothetical protein
LASNAIGANRLNWNEEDTMNNERATSQSQDGRNRQSELQSQYGRIAISAVAAALPYGSETKTRCAETRKPDYAAAEARD